MFNLDKTRKDADKSLNGVWTEIEIDGEKGRCLIARAGNPKFNRIFTRLFNARKFADPQSEDAIAHKDECLARAFADAILLDIEGGITVNGETVEYTPDLGFLIFTDPELQDFQNAVAEFAGADAAYRKELIEDVVKNS